MTRDRISLEDLEAWAEEDLGERMDDLRIAAMIHWVHHLAGFRL